FEVTLHRGRQAVHPAARPPRAASFEERRMNRARGQRVRADQQRVDRERLAQLRVADEAADGLVNGHPGAVPGERRYFLEHRQRAGRPIRLEELAAFPAERAAMGEQRVETGDVGWVEPGDL